jgi:hypothetical protein
MQRKALAASAVCLVLTAAESVRAAQDLYGLDLRLKPADVAPPPSPPYRSTTGAPSAEELAAVEASALDHGPQIQTPNRRKAGTGSLDTFAGDDELLKELLEDKTIPLFRIRVASPF